MNSELGFFRFDTMRDAREQFKRTGISLFLFIALFALLKNFIFFPAMGKIWELALSTTPDGFISNANLVPALTKSPWVLLIGAALIVVFAVLAMWQVSALIVGISYTRSGQRIRLRDLLRLSVTQLRGRLRPKNRMLLVYSLIIVPLSDIYQTNYMIKSFVIPEYIQDFINSKMLLFVLYLLLFAFIIYLALRWFFLLPSFVLKKKDFKAARDESRMLTQKSWFSDGVNMALYSFLEFLRLSLLPILIIMLPVFISYCCTRDLRYAPHLYNTLGITLGLETIRSISGSLLQISIMYFLIELYHERLRECGMDNEVSLPALEVQDKCMIPLRTLVIAGSGIFAIAIAGIYLGTVMLAQHDSGLIPELFGQTEIIAHKGYSSEAPENTMPAFELADKCVDVTYIELDVWSSKDGIPVVIHNSTIEDATGIDRNIYDCTYDELQSIPAPYSMPEEDFPDARIPSLEEVIAKYAHSTPLLIEIKGFAQDPTLSAKIVELMKKYGCEYTSLIHSGDYNALAAVKKLDPKIRCGLILAMVTGDYYNLPYADFFSVEHTFIDRDIVSQIHLCGKKIFAWTVNYDESADELRFSGVDGLITDYPEDIAEYVSETNELLQSVVNSRIVRVRDSAQTEAAVQSYTEGEY